MCIFESCSVVRWRTTLSLPIPGSEVFPISPLCIISNNTFPHPPTPHTQTPDQPMCFARVSFMWHFLSGQGVSLANGTWNNLEGHLDAQESKDVAHTHS